MLREMMREVLGRDHQFPLLKSEPGREERDVPIPARAIAKTFCNLIFISTRD